MKDGQANRVTTDRVRPPMLESWMEEEEDEQNPHNKRKTSQAEMSADGPTMASSARPSLGGVSIGAISSGDTSVLINPDETNDSPDWSPEIPFENVSNRTFLFPIDCL